MNGFHAKLENKYIYNLICLKYLRYDKTNTIFTH